jgi:hypothetical protein
MLVLREGERKKFFFEKKNQKTFVSFYTGCCNVPREQKFFAELFYKKATACLPFLEAFTP